MDLETNDAGNGHIVVSGAAAGPALPDLAPATAERIAASVASARAAGTRRTYASAWRAFTTWCTNEGHTAVPA
ncbi:integrase, partial [Rhodococcus sp. SJ]